MNAQLEPVWSPGCRIGLSIRFPWSQPSDSRTSPELAINFTWPQPSVLALCTNSMAEEAVRQAAAASTFEARLTNTVEVLAATAASSAAVDEFVLDLHGGVTVGAVLVATTMTPMMPAAERAK